MRLPVYSDSLNRCKDCGSGAASTEYSHDKKWAIGPDGQSYDVPHLIRTCNNCEYFWDEATLDPDDAQ